MSQNTLRKPTVSHLFFLVRPFQYQRSGKLCRMNGAAGPMGRRAVRSSVRTTQTSFLLCLYYFTKILLHILLRLHVYILSRLTVWLFILLRLHVYILSRLTVSFFILLSLHVTSHVYILLRLTVFF